MKKIKYLLLVSILHLTVFLSADIIETHNIEDILPAIESVDTLVLFDMDDTLTDSTISLGTGAWRKYVREKVAEYEKQYGKPCELKGVNLHDFLTSLVALKVPVKPVEEAIPKLIYDLQSGGIPIFVLTARGKSKWYSWDTEGIDALTDKQLLNAGLDFSKTILPFELEKVDSTFYSNGVFYSSPLKKGAFLKKLLNETGYRPAKIVFIDDKLDQLQSMERAAKELGISFAGFLYTHADKVHQNFDPSIATIQLMYLFYGDLIIDDSIASVKIEQMKIEDPDSLFQIFLILLTSE
jgi:hypothetical protein